jgi:O-antigen/teichoic acid export membrane protein
MRMGLLKIAALVLWGSLTKSSIWLSAFPLVVGQSLVSSQLGISTQVLRAEGKYTVGVVCSNSALILATLLAVVGIAYGATVNSIILLFAFAKAFGEGLIVLYVRSAWKLKRNLAKTALSVVGFRNLLDSKWFLWQQIAETAIISGSVVWLSHYGGQAQAGLYAAARSVGGIILQSVNIAITPISHDLMRLSRGADTDRFQAVLELISILITLAITVLLAFIYQFGASLFDLWTRGKFSDARFVIALMSLAVAVRTAYYLAATILQSENDSVCIYSVAAIRLIAFGGLAMAQLPTALMFSLSALTCEIAAAFTLIYFWHRNPQTRRLLSLSSSLLPSAAVVAVTMVCWLSGQDGVVAVIVICASCCIALAYRARGVSPNVRGYMRRYASDILQAVGVRV